MKYEVAFSLFKAQEATLNELWTFYATVSLALLAAAIGSDKFKASKSGVIIILVGFWMFSIGNYIALIEVQTIIIELANIANKIAGSNPRLENLKLTPSSIFEIRIFHFVCDISLTIAIYYVSMKSWKAVKDNK